MGFVHCEETLKNYESLKNFDELITGCAFRCWLGIFLRLMAGLFIILCQSVVADRYLQFPWVSFYRELSV